MKYGIEDLNFDDEGDADSMAEMPESRPEGSRRNRREYGKGASSVTARRDHSNPKQTLLMEAVVERENMKRAYDRVIANKGSAGIDRMEVEELMPYLKEQWTAIRIVSRILCEFVEPG